MSVLDRYTSAKIRHPSWRIYKAIDTIRSDVKNLKIYDEIAPEAFGLKGDIDVYYPFETNDELTDEIVDAIMREDYTDSYFCIAECMGLFLDTKQRQLIEIMLMSGLLPEEVAADLGQKSAMVETYANVFFDVSVWRTRADRMAYLLRGTIGEDARIKNMAEQRGVDYVLTSVFNMPAKIRMDKALANLFGVAYKQAINRADNDDNDDQKCAQEWVKRTIEIYRELKAANTADGGIKELKIALETRPAPAIGIDDLE